MKKKKEEQKIRVSKTYLELQPYGASAGMRAYTIELGKEGEEIPVSELVPRIKKEIPIESFEELLTGKLHLAFKAPVGEDAARLDNRAPIKEFLESLSQVSLDFQVKELKLEADSLRPPFTEIHSTCSYFNGQEMFYENFNYVVIEVEDPNEAPKQNFACVEAARHPFSTFVFKVKDKDDWKGIYANYIDAGCSPELYARLFVVPATGTPEEMMTYMKECAKISLKYGVRCGNHLGISL